MSLAALSWLGFVRSVSRFKTGGYGSTQPRIVIPKSILTFPPSDWPNATDGICWVLTTSSFCQVARPVVDLQIFIQEYEVGRLQRRYLTPISTLSGFRSSSLATSRILGAHQHLHRREEGTNTPEYEGRTWRRSSGPICGILFLN